jgi:hypothetical protein
MAASGLVCWHELSVDNANKAAAQAGDPVAIAASKDAQRISRTWGTGLFAAGAGAVAIAAVLYFTAPQRERITQTVFAPAIGPDQVGFVARGSF